MRIDAKTELVIAADIGRRLAISKQRVGVLAAGPGFPRPVGMLGRSQVWRWASVERWARDTARLPADDCRSASGHRRMRATLFWGVSVIGEDGMPWRWLYRLMPGGSMVVAVLVVSVPPGRLSGLGGVA